MGETRRALLRIEQAGYGDPDVVRLVAAVQEEYVERYGGPDETPLDPLMFVPPAGSFFVGYEDGEPVAMGAWRRREVPALGATDPAEIKRMYVVPPARGRGHARAVLAHLETTAAAAGVDALVLETGEAQPEAIALYESAGYVPVAGFGLYRDSPLSRYYGRRLTPSA
ncbi:GNAT family N-acetyltransferase [Nocardioides marinquilinus]|uniref:GNAT family N-acetyltransferase n=1 Tax=Nocardioides marinquilinus TaxID=1210400 RepID=A0ABP9PGP9_9ACTN